jgi:hypothetical protein
MARKRRIGPTHAVGRAKAGLTRGVDPAERIKRWIGASGRKRLRGTAQAGGADSSSPCEVITLTWAQTFGRPAKVPSVMPKLWSERTPAPAPLASGGPVAMIGHHPRSSPRESSLPTC